MTVLLPGAGGTLTDGLGNVWSITSAGDVMENSSAVAGGGGSAALTLVGNVAWALDGTPGGDWYTFAGGIWNDQGATKPAVVPNQVASITVGTVTSSSVALSWAAPILATSYVVQRSTDGGTTFTDLGTSSIPSFTPSSLSAGAYQFRACGVDSTGRGAFSPAVSVTIGSGGGVTKATVQAQISQAETLTAQVNTLLVSINTNVGLL